MVVSMLYEILKKNWNSGTNLSYYSVGLSMSGKYKGMRETKNQFKAITWTNVRVVLLSEHWLPTRYVKVYLAVGYVNLEFWAWVLAKDRHV